MPYIISPLTLAVLACKAKNEKVKWKNSRCSELLPVVGWANTDFKMMWNQHTLEMRALNMYIQPALLEKMFIIVLVDETYRVGGNLVIITGKPSWALLLSLEPQPAVFTVKRERRAEWRMGSHRAIVFLCQLFCLVAIGLLPAFVYAWVSCVL